MLNNAFRHSPGFGWRDLRGSGFFGLIAYHVADGEIAETLICLPHFLEFAVILAPQSFDFGNAEHFVVGEIAVLPEKKRYVLAKVSCKRFLI